MIEQLITHLSKRPIAPILDSLKDKCCEKALKFMSVVDYYTDDQGLYDRMKQNPKLIMQLMKFYSYESFQYYECHFGSTLKELIGDKILKCKFCELIAPYVYTLEHIVISHGTHISLKECLYCNRELALHDKVLIQTCYWKHLAANDINIIDYDIVTVENFYKLMKEIAKHLDVLIRRHDTFAGVRYLKKDPIKLEIEGLPLMYEVSKSKVSSKNINNEILENFFRKAMTQLYGSKSLTMFRTMEPSIQDNSTIIISDDDDENRSVGNDQPNQEPVLHTPVLRPIKLEEIDSITETTTTTTFKSPEKVNEDTPPEKVNEDTPPEKVNEDTPPQNEPAPGLSTVKDERDESQSEEFGRYVGSRLRRLSDTRKRRRLELEIQKAIIKLEEEDI